ncbi:ester cyclase [Bradyrhizobium sp. LTSP885]|uniref:ester cyclase n=1 Tax=Bradyrhizobium sp. LTSP885 TaxID=1619232 RepID=UPI0009E1B774|nr:ester cyclase [Bradyrhizobium sp. LTSP885]
MTDRRIFLALATAGAAAAIAPHAMVRAASSADANAANSALLDRYAAAINAHDTTVFPTIFTEDYIQHSGRSPSGLPAQVENFHRIQETWPDIQMHVEDRIIDGAKVVARCTYTATHDHVVRGFAGTGKRISFATVDIWRVESGKFAEHWDLIDTVGLEKQLSGK